MNTQPTQFVTADGKPVDSALHMVTRPQTGDVISIGGTPEAPDRRYVVTDEPARFHRASSSYLLSIVVKPA